MRKYQITKRDDHTQQMTVCVDIIDKHAQLLTIMDIQIDGDFEFFKYFPWHIYSIVHRPDLEKWCFDSSEMFISMYYGDVDGEREISVDPIPPTPVGNNYLYFEAAEANSTVSLMSMLETAPDLEYSTDGETWQEWENAYDPESMLGPAYIFDIITLTDVGDRIYLRGVNLNGLANMETEQFSIFVLSGKLGAYGSPMSLIDGTGSSTVVPDSGFTELFSGYFAEETLIHLPDMSKITQIGKNGCAAMFCANALITDAEDMPLLTRIDEGGCKLMYAEGCFALAHAANMPLIDYIGEEGCVNMYRSATSLVVPANLGTNMQLGEDSLSRMYFSCDQIDLVENDQLTFSFNQLPTAYGSSTLADAAAVVHEMTYE